MHTTVKRRIAWKRVALAGVCATGGGAFAGAALKGVWDRRKGSDESKGKGSIFFSQDAILVKKLKRDAPFKEGLNGLKWRDLTEGEGPPVPDGPSQEFGDVEVRLTFVGRRDDGYVAHSSQGFSVKSRLDREPKTVIEGINIGVKGMRPGGKRQILCPGHLGRPLIHPDPLFYDIELSGWKYVPAVSPSSSVSGEGFAGPPPKRGINGFIDRLLGKPSWVPPPPCSPSPPPLPPSSSGDTKMSTSSSTKPQ